METASKIVIELRLSKQKALIALTFILLAWHPGILESETLTLTTYYPAPYGGYVKLLTQGSTFLAHEGGNVTVGPGVAAARGRLDIRSGGIVLDHDSTIDSRGDLHLAGTGMLYLDHTNGVNLRGDLNILGDVTGLCQSFGYGVGSTSACGGGGSGWMIITVGGTFSQSVTYEDDSNNPIPIAPGYPAAYNGTGLSIPSISGTMTCCRIS